jgi:hypothetical protein
VALNHRFLCLEMRGTARVPTYEAIVFIGRDNLSERYVAHWLDVSGGRWSETLGYGTKSGQAVEFVFEYPDGPFRTTFAQGAWRLVGGHAPADPRGDLAHLCALLPPAALRRRRALRGSAATMARATFPASAVILAPARRVNSGPLV